jgi:hypothetical protein
VAVVTDFRFALLTFDKGPWTAAKLGNPPKQVVVRDIMINPKTNLGLTRGW